MGGLRRVSLLIPEASAGGLREFRARHRLGVAGGTHGWRRVSPSAELMVDPESGAQCAIRDSRAPGTARYFWTLTVFGYHQVGGGTPRGACGGRFAGRGGIGGLRGGMAGDAAGWECDHG
jgi:hypothetical protein